MDPLSLSASVAGLLGAAGQLCTIMQFLSSSWSSQRTVRDCQQEISHVLISLRSLERYLQRLGAIDPQRTMLIQLDDLIITLSDAMMTFSEFEDLLRHLEAMTKARVAISWIKYSKDLEEHLAKMQRFKTSLNLMLTIVQCDTDLEARETRGKLQVLVETVLNDNKELCAKLRQLEDRFDARSTLTCELAEYRQEEDENFDRRSETSTIRMNGNNGGVQKKTRFIDALHRISFTFESILEQSWVYKRNQGNECDRSFITSDTRSRAWSVFSGISLAEISIISVIAMPLTLLEMRHCSYYQVGTNLAEQAVPTGEAELNLGHSLVQLLGRSGADINDAPSPSVADNEPSEPQDGGYLLDEFSDEDEFLCKGCDERLEEGNAFELAGNRWHLNCFRCSTCGTLLDSDSILLLLGDGSLICNNCTYDCSACGIKIEDLAILTGDQAFCATCFRCRNCKRKIENLRYARTSQGIFCMSCHESLMARRRKKSKAAAQAKAREKENSPMIVDKSLPALPPNAIPNGAFSNDRVDPDSDTPTELSPRPRPSYSRNDSETKNTSIPARSPERDHRDKDAGLSLPQTSYRANRVSTIFSGSDVASNATGDDSGFFIPVALDPSPLPSATPRSASETHPDDPSRRNKEKDYFSLPKNESSSRKKTDSQSSAPHIAFQERGRQSSSDYESSPAKVTRKLSKSSKPDKSAKPSPTPPEKSNGRSRTSGDFKLQEAPKSKKQQGNRSASQSVGSHDSAGPIKREKENFRDSTQLLHSLDSSGTPRTSQDSRPRDDDEVRSPDSATAQSKSIARKELPPSASRTQNDGPKSSNSYSRSKDTDDAPPRPPPRPSAEAKMSDSYMAPRAPPAPPGQKDSKGVGPDGEPRTSPKLPRWSSGGDFSMEEDMARILGTDEGSSSIMRRVSSAVRHGRTSSAEQSNSNTVRIGHTRSVSESTRGAASPRWPKSPLQDDLSNGQLAPTDDPAFLKRRLRTSEQRVAELERQFNNEKDLQTISLKLEEKRKTVSILDTQTEIMIRQLEVLAGYVEKAKETKRPIDPRELEESALKDFVQKLDKLKLSMTATLEQLHSERDDLIEEKNQAIADRDRALMEFEQLSSKNAQLAEMNNDLTHQIQERFKNHSDTRPMNGLGIYHQHKGTSNHSISLDSSSIQTGTTLIPDQEEPIVEAGPTVVNIRKGKVQKFSWKKGTKMAQNIAKGVNRTVGALQQPERREPQFAGENIGLPYNMTHTVVDAAPVQMTPINGQNRQNIDGGRQGFFGFKKAATAPRTIGASLSNSSNQALPEAADVLFGSELTERADYEKRQIPCVVTRCIEEVELRGMDMEGIYRKTGGNSQVKQIQEGFDKNENFDISDPDLDITAVTSVLKQYFRKLPTPLLTYDVYDRVLETNSITDDSDKCDHLRKTFNTLPQKHRDCLEFLMFHLVRVAQREPENLMSPKNLAVVFAPTIMRDKNIEREMTDMHAKNNAVQFIIENSQIIFSED